MFVRFKKKLNGALNINLVAYWIRMLLRIISEIATSKEIKKNHRAIKEISNYTYILQFEADNKIYENRLIVEEKNKDLL